MTKKKNILHSLTFWVNLIVVVITGISGYIIPISPDLSLAVLGLVNVALRFKTRRPII